MTLAVEDTTGTPEVEQHILDAGKMAARIAVATGVPLTTVAALVIPCLVQDDQERLAAPIHRHPVNGPAVRFLVLHGYGVEDIAAATAIPPARIQRYLDGPNSPQAGSQRIVALAKKGLTVDQIRRETGARGKGHVYRTLAQAHLTPPRNAPAVTVHQRARVLHLYRDGMPYKGIADTVGVPLHAVKNTLRAAWLRGDLPEYGYRKGWGS